MKDDVNKRLCELLGCDVPRPKDTCPLCGKTNTDAIAKKERRDKIKAGKSENDI